MESEWAEVILDFRFEQPINEEEEAKAGASQGGEEMGMEEDT